MTTDPCRRRLEGDDFRRRLAALPGWAGDPAAIRRRYQFADFVAAFSFMSAVALTAERMNHHPDWSNSWRTVDITLTTHDAGGVTPLDFALAEACDELARRAPAATP